jgi:hypothetical protein
MQRLTVDLVTESPGGGALNLVLVEMGPWPAGMEEAQLRRIQDRLYDCVDAAVDGHVAGKFPSSRGRPVVVRLEAYDLPSDLLVPFFERFRTHIAASPEIQAAIAAQGHVQSLAFELISRTAETA